MRETLLGCHLWYKKNPYKYIQCVLFILMVKYSNVKHTFPIFLQFKLLLNLHCLLQLLCIHGEFLRAKNSSGILCFEYEGRIQVSAFSQYGFKTR